MRSFAFSMAFRMTVGRIPFLLEQYVKVYSHYAFEEDHRLPLKNCRPTIAAAPTAITPATIHVQSLAGETSSFRVCTASGFPFVQADAGGARWHCDFELVKAIQVGLLTELSLKSGALECPTLAIGASAGEGGVLKVPSSSGPNWDTAWSDRFEADKAE